MQNALMDDSDTAHRAFGVSMTQIFANSEAQTRRPQQFNHRWVRTLASKRRKISGTERITLSRLRGKLSDTKKWCHIRFRSPDVWGNFPVGRKGKATSVHTQFFFWISPAVGKSSTHCKFVGTYFMNDRIVILQWKPVPTPIRSPEL